MFMNILDFILIGLALAMDACAVTIANCTTYGENLTKRKEWAMPIIFSLFQFLMPVIGFYIGYLFASYIAKFSGYITSAVFFILSAKIVFDILCEKEEKTRSNFSLLVIFIQGIATSIDALLIGFTFGACLSSPFFPALIIGVVTFILTSACLLFGKTIGKIFGKYAEWVGAIILFILSAKALIEAIIG